MAKKKPAAKAAARTRPAAVEPKSKALSPEDAALKRQVRSILDAKEYQRPRQNTDSDWTISALLSLDAPHEAVIRACAKNLGSWHRVGFLMRLCASLPEYDVADDTLRRALSSKDEDKKRMALWSVGFGGRVELVEEVGAAALDGEMGDWTRDTAIDVLGTLGSSLGVPPLLTLAKKPKSLEARSPWVNAWSVLKALGPLEAKEAEPFFRRYHPLAPDVKPKSHKPIDHQILGAWGLARLGDSGALDWLGRGGDDDERAGWGELCDVLWWSASTSEEYARLRDRYAAHRAGEKTVNTEPKIAREVIPMDGTIEDLNKAIAREPGDRRARIRRGNLCFDAGMMQRAMHDYGSAVRAEAGANDLAVARLWLTRARFRQRDFADAALRRWHGDHGERLDAHRRRVVLHLVGRVSIDELTQGATSPEDVVEAWFFAGARALFLGDAESGRRALERALTAVTKSPTAEQLSARALLEANR